MAKKRMIVAITIITLIALAIIISFVYDATIVEAISKIRANVLTDIFLGFTFVTDTIIIFFFLTSLFLWKEHKRRWILPLWLSLGFSVLVSYIIKIIIQRPRPSQSGLPYIEAALEQSFATWNFSFPSFQAMLAFSALPILNKEFPKFKYIWAIFAVIVAFSRLYFGVHYLSDVIFGAAIGYLLGMLFVFIEDKKQFGKRIIERLFKR